MIILGMTGSIGMGKSATADLFREEGIPVYDADLAVHALYQKGGAAVGPISGAFPGTVSDGAVDRMRLREQVIDDPEAMRKLERIVHPLAAGTQEAFRLKARQDGRRLIILDIPLLFETGGDRSCTHTLVVTAPASVQRQRVLARPGMTAQVLDKMLARQMPDGEKRARADFILSTAYGFEFARDHVRAIISLMDRLYEEGID